jgi:cell wall-associated NlpC family hydrolase
MRRGVVAAVLAPGAAAALLLVGSARLARAQSTDDVVRRPLVGTLASDAVPATYVTQVTSAQAVAAKAAPAAKPAALSPLAALSASAAALRDSIVAFARSQIGRRYVFGGDSPERGFDCSGLTRYLMARFNVRLPRTAREQALAGNNVGTDRTALRPGDLLTFGRGTRISHVGIYVGNGHFIHASSVAGHVIESSLDRPPSPRIKPWRGTRRLLAPGDSAAVKQADG